MALLLSSLSAEHFTLAMTMSESIARFKQYNEGHDIEEYFKQLEFFLKMHKISVGEKVIHLLSDIGLKIFLRY